MHLRFFCFCLKIFEHKMEWENYEEVETMRWVKWIWPKGVKNPIDEDPLAVSEF